MNYINVTLRCFLRKDLIETTAEKKIRDRNSDMKCNVANSNKFETVLDSFSRILIHFPKFTPPNCHLN